MAEPQIVFRKTIYCKIKENLCWFWYTIRLILREAGKRNNVGGHNRRSRSKAGLKNHLKLPDVLNTRQFFVIAKMGAISFLICVQDQIG